MLNKKRVFSGVVTECAFTLTLIMLIFFIELIITR